MVKTGDAGQPTAALERGTRSEEEEDDEDDEDDDDVDEEEEEEEEENEDEGLATLPSLGDPCAAARCDELFEGVGERELDAVAAPPSDDRRSGAAALGVLFAARGDGVKVRGATTQNKVLRAPTLERDGAREQGFVSRRCCLRGAAAAAASM